MTERLSSNSELIKDTACFDTNRFEELSKTGLSLKGIDMVKSWPGPGQKYNLLYSTASTHPVSLCS